MLLNCACIVVRVLKKQDFITSYFIVSLCIGMAMALALSVLALLTSLTDSKEWLKLAASTHVLCEHCGNERRNEPRRGGDAVRHTHQSASVLRSDVHVVGEESA